MKSGTGDMPLRRRIDTLITIERALPFLGRIDRSWVKRWREFSALLRKDSALLYRSGRGL